MTTKAKSSKGTLLKVGDGATPEVFSTIAEVLDIDGPGVDVGEIDATSMDSTADESIPDGIPNHGEVGFELIMNGVASQQALETDAAAGTTRNYKLVSNDHASSPSTRTFAAWVKSFKPKAPVRGKYTASCTLRVTGAVTRTYRPA